MKKLGEFNFAKEVDYCKEGVYFIPKTKRFTFFYLLIGFCDYAVICWLSLFGDYPDYVLSILSLIRTISFFGIILFVFLKIRTLSKDYSGVPNYDLLSVDELEKVLFHTDRHKNIVYIKKTLALIVLNDETQENVYVDYPVNLQKSIYSPTPIGLLKKELSNVKISEEEKHKIVCTLAHFAVNEYSNKNMKLIYSIIKH